MLGGEGGRVAEEGMIQQMFQFRRGDGAVLDLGYAWNVGFAAIMISLADVEVRRGKAQEDSGFQEVTLVVVLEEVEAFLGEMAFDFGSGAGADNPEMDIEPGGGGCIFANRDGVPAGLRLFRDEVLVEKVLELPGAIRVVLEPDTIEFEVALKGIHMDRSGLAHPTIHGEVGEAAEACFGTFGASESFDQDVGEVIEVDAKSAVGLVRGGTMGGGWGGFGGNGGGGSEVLLIDLRREGGGGIRGIRMKGLAVILDGAVGMDGERLGGLDEATCAPFERVELEPGFRGDEDGAFGAEGKDEVGGAAFGAGIDFDIDPATVGGVGGFSHGGEIGGRLSAGGRSLKVRGVENGFVLVAALG